MFINGDHLSSIKHKTNSTQLWAAGKHYKIWAFNAPMGAGKTTLIRALCDMLKVKNTVSSPTFAIINEYTSSVAGIMYHMDWYRIKDDEEAIQAGCKDCIDSDNYCFVEWPERATNLLPDNVFNINIEMVDATSRKLTTLNSY